MDLQYRILLQHILDSNKDNPIRNDRTGVGTLSVFGYQMRFDLKKGFPAQTTKKLAWKAVVGELLWFLEGSANERRLAELTYSKNHTELSDKKTIWTENANNQGKSLGYDHGHLGPVYGVQWRYFAGSNRDELVVFTDQIENIINQIKNDPTSRRIILTAWNPSELVDMALPPCHIMSQFYVKDGKLSCMMTQRSCDVFLGLPFNIASYALLTHILARECDLGVDELIINLGDAHIYSNHFEQVEEVISRTPYELPELKINDKFELQDIFPFTRLFNHLETNEMFTLENYTHHEAIKAKMAV